MKLPGRHVGEDLGQRAFVGVGQRAVWENEVAVAVDRVASERLLRPLMFTRRVVHDEIDAQRDAAVMQVVSERLQIGHRADTGIDLVIVLHGVTAVVLTGPRLEQRHQVQVSHPELDQVVEVFGHSPE